MREEIKGRIDEQLDDLFETANYIHDHPETGFEERLSAAKLIEKFEEYGFTVDRNYGGIETAFRAVYDSGKPGPTVGFFCEYDALPEIGHGCGHNLICTMSMGAAVGLKDQLNELGGKIYAFGTPAEETSGAKVTMTDKGLFNDLTFAMMAHPNPVSEVSGTSMALVPLEFVFHGKTAHAAACPEQGINALDSVIFLFNGINAIRQHVAKDIMFHGFIPNGGVAANVVPDLAIARFYMRAKKKKTLLPVIERVKEIARGAAEMTGATVEISQYEEAYDDMQTNQTMSNVFNKNLMEMGETKIQQPTDGIGSIDMGNVSQVVPAIHGWIGFGDPSLVIHSKEFADRTVTEEGRKLLYRGACALALTAYDVMASKELLDEIIEEFKQNQ